LPISGSERFQLLPFTRKQRSQYLLARFGQSGLAGQRHGARRTDSDAACPRLCWIPVCGWPRNSIN
jgi:hypothetical protein